MTTSVINFSLIKKLIHKDWLLFQKQMALYVIGAVVALCLMGNLHKWTFYIGSLLLIIVVVAVACFSISNSLLVERRDRTLAFIMSLPVSPLDFYLAKLAGNLVTFLVPLLVIAAGTYGVILFTGLPDGLVVLATLLFTHIVLAFCASLSTAMAVESEGWNTFVMIASMVLINPYIMLIGQTPSIAEPIKTEAIVWSGAALSIMGIQAILSILILALTGWFHCRKKSFY
ncbi:hypothetical protein C7S18_07940 [Ahniella affigens]|uniref:ABC-2 type transporter transmembrane domain-containing protein n=1 Tax=Ahniella affigens TaxID=2021234 RepID=A0A2P1PQJ8_9GAMM|nr:ABC transporter permease [Ahniella affigens]AVP97126.1 hypothetical protein C7S18_07940 [Ahniella affigens]